MIELIKKLASLQAELKAEEDATNADGIVITLREAVDDAAKQLEAAKTALSDELISYESAVELIDADIEETKAHIVDAWDGERKTVETDAGTITFRTTYSLKIFNKQEPRVLEDLLDHFNTPEAIMEYINGFNKTKLKAYMVIHPPSTDVAGLVPKTTVKLEAVNA